jgi:hypothetical protein
MAKAANGGDEKDDGDDDRPFAIKKAAMMSNGRRAKIGS